MHVEALELAEGIRLLGFSFNAQALGSRGKKHVQIASLLQILMGDGYGVGGEDDGSMAINV